MPTLHSSDPARQSRLRQMVMRNAQYLGRDRDRGPCTADFPRRVGERFARTGTGAGCSTGRISFKVCGSRHKRSSHKAVVKGGGRPVERGQSLPGRKPVSAHPPPQLLDVRARIRGGSAEARTLAVEGRSRYSGSPARRSASPRHCASAGAQLTPANWRPYRNVG